jgi:ribosomal protein S18 acetylase RimI-like enzyme
MSRDDPVLLDVFMRLVVAWCQQLFFGIDKYRMRKWINLMEGWGSEFSPYTDPKPASKNAGTFTVEDNLRLEIEYNMVKAFDGNTVIGAVTLMSGNKEGEMSVHNTEVKPAYRRKGVANAMYDACEAIVAGKGKTLVPATSLSDDAFHLWNSRKPEIVAGDRRHFQDHYLGKTVIRDRDGAEGTIISVPNSSSTYFNIQRKDANTTFMMDKKEVIAQLGDHFT